MRPALRLAKRYSSHGPLLVSSKLREISKRSARESALIDVVYCSFASRLSVQPNNAQTKETRVRHSHGARSLTSRSTFALGQFAPTGYRTSSVGLSLADSSFGNASQSGEERPG